MHRQPRRERPIYHLLKRAFEGIGDTESSDFRDHQEDFAFHMMDWEDELTELQKVFQTPEDYSVEKVRMILLRFIDHATGHLNAAARLCPHFTDPFSVEEQNQESSTS